MIQIYLAKTCFQIYALLFIFGWNAWCGWIYGKDALLLQKWDKSPTLLASLSKKTFWKRKLLRTLYWKKKFNFKIKTFFLFEIPYFELDLNFKILFNKQYVTLEISSYKFLIFKSLFIRLLINRKFKWNNNFFNNRRVTKRTLIHSKSKIINSLIYLFYLHTTQHILHNLKAPINRSCQGVSLVKKR